MLEARTMKPLKRSLGQVLEEIRKSRGFSVRKWAKEIYGQDDTASYVMISKAEKDKIEMPRTYVLDLMAVAMLTETEKTELRSAIADRVLEG